MKKTIFFAISLALTTPLAFADSFAEKCPDIVTCANVVSQLLGQKYVFDKEVNGKWVSTSNVELTKENAEVLFTNMLYTLNYSRVPLALPNTYEIVRHRDARDLAVPTYYGNAKLNPALPDTWDMATLVYTLTDPAVGSNIVRVLRNIMPPNTRMLSTDTGKLFLTDSQVNLKKLYSFVKELDVKPTPELRKKWAEDEKRWAAERLAAAKSEQGKSKQ